MTHQMYRVHPTWRAPVLALVSTVVMIAGAGAGYAMPDAPGAPAVASGWEQPTGDLAVVTDANDAGLVVGMDREYRGMRWDSATGETRVLDLPPDATHLSAFAINADGQVAGQLVRSGPIQHAARWSPDGTVIDLDTSATSYSQSWGINDAGHVVGQSRDPGLHKPSHAFWWTPEQGMVDIGMPPGTAASLASDVNHNDLVVGMSQSLLDGSVHAFAWTEATGMVELGMLPGGTNAAAEAVNEHGVIVGRADDADRVEHVVRWTLDAGVVDLGTVGYGARPTDINDSGTIVGTWTWSTGNGPNQFRAFRLTPAGEFEDLGVPALDNGVSEASAVDNHGRIAGNTTEPGETVRGFFWQQGTPGGTTTTTVPSTSMTTTNPTTTNPATTAPPATRAPGPTPITATPSYTG